MSTNVTAVPQNTLRPFLAGALAALLMALLVIGIALAINLNATRTAEKARVQAAPVVNNEDYSDRHAGLPAALPQAHVGAAPDSRFAPGNLDRQYAELSRPAAPSTFSPALGPIAGYGSGSATATRDSDASSKLVDKRR